MGNRVMHNSPPQQRRGRRGVFKKMSCLISTTPALSRHPSSAEEGSWHNARLLLEFILILALTALPASAQTASYRAPRLNGHPDLNGIWQAVNTANWDLQDHGAQPATFWQTGAIGAVPAGQSVVEGGDIPYTAAGLEKKKANFAKRQADDPEAKCYMPGLPRATYMPYPFQIVQSQGDIIFVYEYA